MAEDECSRCLASCFLIYFFMRLFKNPIQWVLSAILLTLYFIFQEDSFAALATSPFVDLAGGCAKMLRYMGDLTGKNYAFLLGRKTGAIDLLTSPANGGVKYDLNNTQPASKGGKKFIKTKVHYKKRAKPCEILEDANVPSICNDGSEPVELSVDTNINKHLSTPIITFSNSNMVNICQDTEQFMQEYVLSYRRALLEKADEYLLTQIDAAVGRWKHQDGSAPAPIGGSTVKRLLGTDSTTGTVVPLFANYMDILLDYQQNQLTGTPFILAEGYFQKFMMAQKYSCCNADGVAYDSAVAAAGAAFFIDQAVNSIIAPNAAFVIAPGAVHLLAFNENNNINMDTPLEKHIVMQDPVYPQLSWDLDFRWDCDKAWNFKMSIWIDLFKAFQTDAFGTDTSPDSTCEDELAGLTGVAQYTITNV